MKTRFFINYLKLFKYRRCCFAILLTLALLSSPLPESLVAEEAATKQSQEKSKEDSAKDKAPEQNALMDLDFNDQPTYIRSKSLSLKSKERVFEYQNDVQVKQGDMTITCKFLTGTYDEQNQIKELIARDNVFITKGEDIRARSEKAIYDAATETVTLTENPELQQKDSVLTADLIRIFLKEDRSTAEGQVRVKLVEDKNT